MSFDLQNFVDAYSLAEVTERMGWVLVHSLWQFTLIGMLLIPAERLMTQRSAAARYLMSTLSLSGMVVVAMLTFGMSDAAVSQSDSVLRGNVDWEQPRVTVLTEDIAQKPYRVAYVEYEDSLDASTPRQNAVTEADSPTQSDAWRNGLVDLRDDVAMSLRPWLGHCVSLWMFGMLIASLRPVSGGLNVRRLRRKGIKPAPEEINRLLKATARRVGVRRAVEAMQSALVTGPVVIGWLKPLLLLPASTMSGLTAEQLEAILAHELAHIRRSDYAVNVLQTLVETVFFYHPAIWWVSRRMRIHREDCCDDRAVALTSNPATYASALLKLHDQKGTSTAPVPLLQATGGSLKKRVYRIVGLESPAPTTTGWWLSTGVVLLLAVLVGCSLVGEQSVFSNETKEDARAKLTADDSDKEADRAALEPVVDPISAPDPFEPTAPARTIEEIEDTLAQLEALGVSRLDSLDISPNDVQGTLPLSAHLTGVPDAAWPLLSRFPSIRRLDVTDSNVSPEAFRHVGGMTSLRHVTIVNSRFEPQHLAFLGTLHNLESIDATLSVFQQTTRERQDHLGTLSLTETKTLDDIAGPSGQMRDTAQAAILTDRALARLASIPSLRKLRLANTVVSDTGLRAVGRHQLLFDVELSCTGPISSQAIAPFGVMPELKRLILKGVINATAVSPLTSAPVLGELEVRAADDSVSAILSEIPSLQRLTLWSSTLTDDGLLPLARLEKLRNLDVRFSQSAGLTLAGIKQFQAARPGCAVLHSLSVDALKGQQLQLPPDHFLIRLHWHRATSRKHLADEMEKRFGKSEYWIEFQPLTRSGYLGGVALVKGVAGRDWLNQQIDADDDFDISYSERISSSRLKEEGIAFAVLKRPSTSDSSQPVARAVSREPVESAPESTSLPALANDPIVKPGESVPSFEELISRLRAKGNTEVADGLQAKYDSRQRFLRKKKRGVIGYGQVIPPTEEPAWLCNAPMKVFKGGWFVTGIADKDRAVGFRMFGCQPVDVIASRVSPGVRPGETVSLGRVVMKPYASKQLAAVRGQLKFGGDQPPRNIRARVVILGGPSNTLTGGTDGFIEWPEKENLTLDEQFNFEHRQLAPLPHRLHIEAAGFRPFMRIIEPSEGATLDLGIINVPKSSQFEVEFLAADTPDFSKAAVRKTAVQLREVWKSNPDNPRLAKYSGGDMSFQKRPLDRKDPDGPEKLFIHSGVASLYLSDLGRGELKSFGVAFDAPSNRTYSRNVPIISGHVYLAYHSHWKHWTLLRVVVVE